jgi:hypothetical protein
MRNSKKDTVDVWTAGGSKLDVMVRCVRPSGIYVQSALLQKKAQRAKWMTTETTKKRKSSKAQMAPTL